MPSGCLPAVFAVVAGDTLPPCSVGGAVGSHKHGLRARARRGLGADARRE